MVTLLRVDIDEDDADYQIFIDGVECHLYRLYKEPEDYGFRKIDIVVNSGRIRIPNKCTAVYDDMILDQSDYIQWFYSKEYKQNTWYDHSISFYHLYAQGPTRFEGHRPIWEYKSTMSGHLIDKETLTSTIRELI